jgi:hypothetical protein
MFYDSIYKSVSITGRDKKLTETSNHKRKERKKEGKKGDLESPSKRVKMMLHSNIWHCGPQKYGQGNEFVPRTGPSSLNPRSE